MGSMEALAIAVKRARLAKGMRGIDLAQAIGKDPSYVTKLEHGTLKEIPDPATLAALSDALGIAEPSLLELIGYRVRAANGAPVITDHRLQTIVARWSRLIPHAQEIIFEFATMAELSGHDEPVVAADVWAAVQRLRNDRPKPSRGKDAYWFQTLLFCGCGTPLYPCQTRPGYWLFRCGAILEGRSCGSPRRGVSLKNVLRFVTREFPEITGPQDEERVRHELVVSGARIVLTDDMARHLRVVHI